MLVRRAHTPRVSAVAPTVARRKYAVGTDVTAFKGTLRDADGNVLSTKDIFKDKKIALLGVPGAFTPVCTNKHLPQYAESLAALKDHKVDGIVCVYVTFASYIFRC